MSIIDFSQHKFLFQLLTQLLTGLNVLNNHDPALRPIIFQLHEILAKTMTISLDNLLSLVHQAQSIAQGYQITPDGDEPSANPITNLPVIFYNLTQEIDHLQTKERVSQASLQFRVKSLHNKIASHYRVAK